MNEQFHTANLMERIHPGLRDKYRLMLADWKQEVSTWTARPPEARTRYDVAPTDSKLPWSVSEDQFLLAHYRHRKTKIIANILGRSPESVFARAQSMGLRKDLP